jgi:holin-like protein
MKAKIVFRFVVGAFLLIMLSIGGEMMAATLHLPIPGPIIGMVSLILALFAKPQLADLIAPAADFIIRWLGALIVPAAAGIVMYGPLFRSHGLALAIVLVTTTLATGLTVALIYRAVQR